MLCTRLDVAIPSRPPAVRSQACGERITPALRNTGTDGVGFSLSGRVLTLSLSISSDIPVASIVRFCTADWSGGPGRSFPSPSLRSRARPRNRSRMPGLLQAGALRAAPGARPPWTTAGGTRGTNCALQDVSIPSRPPAVGSHACGERSRALRTAGTRRAGFSLSSGRVLSLSLTISRDIVVDFIPYITKSRRKTRDGHSHTRVPRIRLARNGHTDSQVLGTMCDLRVRM